jgi:hypothetical protein
MMERVRERKEKDQYQNAFRGNTLNHISLEPLCGVLLSVCLLLLIGITLFHLLFQNFIFD